MLETRAFWRYPLCRGSTRKSGSCSGTLQNTVTTMAADGGNALPNTPHEALRLVPTRQIDWRRPPEQADINLGVLRGCMALKAKALLCSGADASPQHRSVLRAIPDPLNLFKIKSACWGGGGRRPSREYRYGHYDVRTPDFDPTHHTSNGGKSKERPSWREMVRSDSFALA